MGMVENKKESTTKQNQNEVGLLLHQHLVYLNVMYLIHLTTMSPEMIERMYSKYLETYQKHPKNHPRFHQKLRSQMLN